MLCRNCGRSWVEHHPANRQCPGDDFAVGAPVMYWKPSGRLYDDIVDASLIQPDMRKLQSPVRTFDTGATRDQDTSKYDYEAFLSPIVLERFAEYMHKNRVQPDGGLRDGDNWQKGIPKTSYIKSLWRHFHAVWKKHRNGGDPIEDLCAMLFNVQGYMFELLKEKEKNGN